MYNLLSNTTVTEKTVYRKGRGDFKQNRANIIKHDESVKPNKVYITMRWYKAMKKFFMEIFIVAAWLIWKQRNNLIFNKVRPSLEGWESGFLDEARLQAHGMSSNKKQDFLGFLSLLFF
jgi:hypothetical protein